MITSSKRSAAVAALILAAGVALAGCGGDDTADASGDPSATPAWDSTRAPGSVATEPGETPGTTDPPADQPAADGEQPAADEGEAAADQPGGDSGDGGTADGGTGDASGGASGESPGGTDGGTGADGGAQDPPPADPIEQPIDACTLGAEAIAGVLGAGPTPEDLSDPAAFGPSCGWTGASGHEIIVDVAGFDDWISMDQYLGSGAQAVDDLGSEAWAALGSPSNVQVAWRRDDVSVSVAASLESGAEAVLDVARAVDAALVAAGY